MHISRREWMLATLCWAEVLRASDELITFDARTAAEIRAIAAQIIPETDTPGAEKAGVIFFIDRALAEYDKDKRELYSRGLADAQVERARMFPGSTSIAALSSDQQIQLLRAIEKTPFFEQVRLHAILGFLGNPKYGGNRDMVGWKAIGIEHRMQYKPPFGYYDAEAAK